MVILIQGLEEDVDEDQVDVDLLPRVLVVGFVEGEVLAELVEDNCNELGDLVYYEAH